LGLHLRLRLRLFLWAGGTAHGRGITINATAALHDPYDDNLGWPFITGLNYFDAARLESFITALGTTGFDFHIHAIGDRGITEVLHAIEGARLTNGNMGARHRITHLEIVDPLDYPRFAALNVTTDMQVAGDWSNPDHWHDNDFLIGPVPANKMIPIRSLFDNGAARSVKVEVRDMKGCYPSSSTCTAVRYDALSRTSRRRPNASTSAEEVGWRKRRSHFQGGGGPVGPGAVLTGWGERHPVIVP
jgi:Amidohydrolase family